MRTKLNLLLVACLILVATVAADELPTQTGLKEIQTSAKMNMEGCYVKDVKNSSAPYILWVKFPSVPECVVPIERTGYIKDWRFFEELLRKQNYPKLALRSCAQIKDRCYFQELDWMSGLKSSGFSAEEACSEELRHPLDSLGTWACRDSFLEKAN